MEMAMVIFIMVTTRWVRFILNISLHMLCMYVRYMFLCFFRKCMHTVNGWLQINGCKLRFLGKDIVIR